VRATKVCTLKATIRSERSQASQPLHHHPREPRNRKPDIEFLTSSRVEGVDVAAKTLALAEGGVIAFNTLVVATGARVRLLVVAGVVGVALLGILG